MHFVQPSGHTPSVMGTGVSYSNSALTVQVSIHTQDPYLVIDKVVLAVPSKTRLNRSKPGCGKVLEKGHPEAGQVFLKEGDVLEFFRVGKPAVKEICFSEIPVRSGRILYLSYLLTQTTVDLAHSSFLSGEAKP